jgi:hypothetical protein
MDAHAEDLQDEGYAISNTECCEDIDGYEDTVYNENEIEGAEALHDDILEHDYAE